jgi:hypothetical protein
MPKGTTLQLQHIKPKNDVASSKMIYWNRRSGQVQIIRLPQHLPSSKELAQLNRRLRAGEIRLDWRDVTSTSMPGQLESLLKDLDLAEHFDSLGADTVPESLQPAIDAIFARLEKQKKHKIKKSPPQSKRNLLVKPEIWLPEADGDQDGDDINKTIYRIFPENVEQTVLPSPPVRGRDQDEKTEKIAVVTVPSTRPKPA